MSRIPNTAMPHAWSEDSEHARDVRRARGRRGTGATSMAKKAALALGLLAGGALLVRRLRHA